MGSALRLPVVAGMTTDAVMNCMADAGLRMIAAVPRGGEDPDDDRLARTDRPAFLAAKDQD